MSRRGVRKGGEGGSGGEEEEKKEQEGLWVADWVALCCMSCLELHELRVLHEFNSSSVFFLCEKH